MEVQTSKLLKVNEFDCSLISKYGIVKKPRGNPHRKDRTDYKDCICAFDIEATNFPEVKQALMYIWQFQIDLDYTVIGRTWDEFIQFLRDLKEHLGDTKLLIFTHNLSYEFIFLSGVYSFSKEEVFATEDRKILRCSMFENFEFRCSYYLTNMSLDSFTHNMGVDNAKEHDYDYKKIRLPETELSEEELRYCINDVLGLVQALKKKMAMDKDTVYTLPLTSTGYVRREAKKVMSQYNHNQLVEMLPDKNLYIILHQAFRGGNTHCSRWFSTGIVDDVKSVDRSSSYPDCIVNCEYPVKPFFYEGDVSISRFKDLLNNKHKAMVFRMAFWNLRLRSRYWGNPYIPIAKCRNVKDPLEDNGRILEAQYLETSLTDIDFRIILKEYEWDASSIFDCYTSSYGMLPDFFRELVIKYYKGKTELKNKTTGNPEEDEFTELMYHKNKELLNSLYGMMVQDPCKPSIDYIDDQFIEQDRPLEELLAEYKKKAFIPYQWGIWTSAWARLRLEECIDLAGEQFVYADTDSVKYVGDIDLTEYNAQRVSDSLRNGAYATDYRGEVHYMGVFEPEGEYSQFVSYGAKKYCYIENGKLHLTCAGVNKKKGAEELSRKGGIEAFKDGFTFTEAGGTESTYNDIGDGYVVYNYNGKDIYFTSNVYIQDSTYTLGLTQDYLMILAGVMKIKYSEEDIPFFYKKRY